MKSDIRCPTPRCTGYIEKYGERYHRVVTVGLGGPPKFMPDATDLCEGCGGYTNGSEWKHVCRVCGAEVEPGDLVGFFVPSRCKSCDDEIVAKEKAEGRVCSRCKTVFSYCCC